jgi:hypothetical protein
MPIVNKIQNPVNLSPLLMAFSELVIKDAANKKLNGFEN